MKKGMYKMSYIYTKKDQDVFKDSSIKAYNPNIISSKESQLSARLSVFIARKIIGSFRSVEKNISNMPIDFNSIGERSGQTKIVKR